MRKNHLLFSLSLAVLAILIMAAGGARSNAFAMALAQGKIWMSPVWPKDKIARTHLLVKFRSPEKGKERLATLGIKQEKTSALPRGWFRVDTEPTAKALGMRLPKQEGKIALESLKALALALAQDPQVEMVAFDYAVIQVPPKDLLKPTKAPGGEGLTPQAIPTDPLYWAQWHYTATTPKRGANAEAAWDLQVGTSTTVVAVIDTGVTEGPLDGFALPFYMECDTSGAGWVCGPGTAFPVNPHGTHVAGTVAQESSLVTPGDDGLAGMAPGVALFPIQTFDPVWVVASFEDLAEAITLAAQNGADVINMSLGADCGTFTWADGCRHPAVDAAIADAVNNYDVVIVAAAGNASEAVVGYPANHPLVIAVAAGDQDSLAYYSTYGVGLSVTAPGGNYFEDVDGDTHRDLVWQETYILDPSPTGDWGFYGYQGTSMASPHVAGLAALLRSQNPAASWQQVRYCIESTAVDEAYRDDPAPGYDFRYGYGLIDAYAALNCITTAPATLPINAYSSTADLGGISASAIYGATTSAVFYLAETGGGGDLNWTAFTSYAPDCSTTDTVPWLTLVTSSGTLPMYTADSFDITLDSTATGGVGTYSAYICVSSNDPDTGPGNNTNLIPIPVVFTVETAVVAPDEIVCNGPAVTFENGIPTTWTVVDNEGTGVVWDVTGAPGGTCATDGNYTNGSGKAACVNSDATGVLDYDTELITNPIDIPSTATGATLYFTANYQDLAAGYDFFDVDVSTDGGATWTNVLQWDENHGNSFAPPGEDVTLDLSAYVGQTILLRFRYYNPTTSPDWDWYVQIDDVALECAGTPSIQPDINVSPLSLTFTMDPDQSSVQQITVSNVGAADLSWGFGEEDQGFTPLAEKPRAIPEGRRFRLAPEALQQMNIEPQGDRDFIFTTGLLSAPVTVDGQISPGEWDDAAVMNISTTVVPVLFYAKYDPNTNTLYLAVDNRQDPVVSPSDVILLNFDDETGTAPLLFDNMWTYTACPSGETGEGTYFVSPGGTIYDAVISGPTYCGLNLPASVTSAVSDAAGNVQYEIAIPLGGATALQAGADTFFGFDIWVLDGDASTVDGLWPISVDFNDPGTFGNLYLSTQCVASGDASWLSVNPVTGVNAPDTNTTVDVRADSTGLVPGTYQANLCVFSNDPDWPTGENGTGLVVVPVTLNVRAIDLEITKTVDNATPYLGQNVTFTLTLTNTVTAYAASNIVVTDLLPAGLAYVSHNASVGAYDPGSGQWSIPTLPGGDSATLEIVAQVTTVGSITNTAEVTAVEQTDRDSTPGDGMGDDYAEVTLNASEAVDLELTMTANNLNPVPNEEIEVTIEVRNVAPAVAATGVQVEAFFNNGFQYISHSVSQGTATVTFASTHLAWDVGDLNPDATATLTVRLKVLERPQVWSNWAEVVSVDQTDRDSVPGDRRGDDYASLRIRVALPATGFPAGRVTVLPPKPAGLHFADTSMVLEIPRLGIQAPIVGVPTGNMEALGWLGNQVGYIQTTTFPTWRGNSVLTAHNYLSTGLPGPFLHLSQLRWGDVVRIHYSGLVYEYEVRKSTRVTATELWPFEYVGKGTWITLLTCTGQYDEAQRLYQNRIVVQAVLMRIYPSP